MEEILKIKTDEAKLFRKRIDSIGLPDNLCWNLKFFGDIKTVKALAETDAVELLKIHGIGNKSVEIIKQRLAELGLKMLDSRQLQNPIVKTNRVSVMTVDFPKNLLMYLQEKSLAFKCPENVTDDILNGINFAYATLNDEQQVILFLRFQRHKSLSDIGSLLSLSGTQIENIIEKAIHTLVSNKAINYIERGLQGYVNYQIESKASLIAKISTSVEYTKGYNDGLSASHHIESVAQSPEYRLTDPIEKLGFSTRTYNCLTRAGIHTIYELALKTDDELCKVRNLGKKGVEEVYQKLGEQFFCEPGRSPNIVSLVTCAISRIYLQQHDGLLGSDIITEVCLRENELLCQYKNNISPGSYYTYSISYEAWNSFCNELAEQNLLTCSQEDFCRNAANQEIIDDLNYTFHIEYSNGEAATYSGNTSSIGVQAVENLFEKYFSPPPDAAKTDNEILEYW